MAVRAGIINLRLGTTYYYRAIAQNSAGLSSGETRTFTTPAESGTGGAYLVSSNSNDSNNSNISVASGNPANAPLVTANGPASVSSNLAIANGSVNPKGYPTNYWFEFGPTTSLGRKTAIESLGGDNRWYLVDGTLDGLDPGKTYFYRVIAQNVHGTGIGDLVSFITSAVGSTGYGNQVLGVSSVANGANGSARNGNGSSTANSGAGKNLSVKNGATNVTANQVLLEYSVNDDGSLVLVADKIKPKAGEEFGYTVVYKNTKSKLFSEVRLKVIIPSQADFVGSNIDPAKSSGNVVEFNLESIEPDDQGAVVIMTKIKKDTASEINLIFTSVLAYKDEFGNRNTATSYLTVRTDGLSESLSASSLGLLIESSGFLWFIALALVVFMSLLMYRFVKIRKNALNGQNGLEAEKIPPTVEPPAAMPAVEPPMGRADIFQPVGR